MSALWWQVKVDVSQGDEVIHMSLQFSQSSLCVGFTWCTDHGLASILACLMWKSEFFIIPHSKSSTKVYDSCYQTLLVKVVENCFMVFRFTGLLWLRRMGVFQGMPVDLKRFIFCLFIYSRHIIVRQYQALKRIVGRHNNEWQIIWVSRKYL